jgi:hypothetical protein
MTLGNMRELGAMVSSFLRRSTRVTFITNLTQLAQLGVFFAISREAVRVGSKGWMMREVTGANFRAPLPLHVIMTGRDG